MKIISLFLAVLLFTTIPNASKALEVERKCRNGAPYTPALDSCINDAVESYNECVADTQDEPFCFSVWKEDSGACYLEYCIPSRRPSYRPAPRPTFQ